jgi:hypothetical protein
MAALGARALAIIPRKTVKRDQGVYNIPVRFADEDGIVISKMMLV